LIARAYILPWCFLISDFQLIVPFWQMNGTKTKNLELKAKDF
jgi:hypothetical protein